MDNENIKEILEDVKRHLDYVEATKQCSIRDNEMKVMYDYITNLQEENEVLKSQLLQDNKSYHDMQDRIKKAIEYIKENSYFEGNEIKTMIYQDYSKYILETLQGKSDE